MRFNLPLIFLIPLILLVIPASCTHYSISTSDNILNDPAYTDQSQNRVVATTFLSLPQDCSNLTFRVDIYNQSATNSSPIITVGNTTDFRTITGPSYSTTLVNCGSEYHWETITIPNNTYHFSGNVIIRITGNALDNWGVHVGPNSPDESSLKDNEYFDGYDWYNETSSWCFGIDTAYDSNEGALDKPIPSFWDSLSSALVGDIISFYDTSINAVSQLWNFGDNSTSTQANVTHSYANVGTYNVSLNTSNSNGYSMVSHTVTINKATPVITWLNPNRVKNNTLLSSTQLNAIATVNGNTIQGNYTYNPAAGTAVTTGTQTLNVYFIPTDQTNYNNISGSVQLVVYSAVTPTLYCQNIKSIKIGIQPSVIAWDDTVSPHTQVQGGMKAKFNQGIGAKLSSYTVTFSPTDTGNYSNVSQTYTAYVESTSDVDNLNAMLKKAGQDFQKQNA